LEHLIFNKLVRVKVGLGVLPFIHLGDVSVSMHVFSKRVRVRVGLDVIAFIHLVRKEHVIRITLFLTHIITQISHSALAILVQLLSLLPSTMTAPSAVPMS